MKIMRPARILALLLSVFAFFPARPARPADLPTYCFAVYGDTRSGDAEHRKVTAAVLQTRPAAVFHTGDMVADGMNEEDWKTFNEISAPLRKAAEFFPALGNHERESPLYFRNFGVPVDYRWYSVERGGVHVTVLDTNSGLAPGSLQLAWLEQDLKKAGTPFLAVVMHYPPYSTGSHGGEKKLQETVVPLFQKYGVNVVFAGHDHDYERLEVDGITYIVTGGGGAPLHGQERQSPESRVFLKEHHFCRVCVERQGMKVEVLGTDRKVLDRFEIPLKLRPARPTPGTVPNCCGHFTP